jgi:hypothetical protein
MLYLISYDLVKPEQHYDSLIASLRKRGAKRPLLSVWLLSSSTSLDLEALVNSLRREGGLDADDRLFVTEIVAEAYWWNPLIPHGEIQLLYGNARTC